MIRTRDLVVFLSVVLLLVAGIATTLGRDTGSVAVDMISGQQLQATATVITDYTIADMDTDQLFESSSEDHLASMRERIRSYRENSAPDMQRFVVREGEPELIAAVSDVEDVSDSGNVQSVQQCAGYQQFFGFWPSNVVIEEHEGARLVIARHQGDAEADHSPFSGEILAQLPIVQERAVAPTCVSTDVVGIALDGSLIRNDDYAGYSVFGSDTVIGYALDGLPIYGQNDGVSTDQCGGGNGSRGYGYILQSDRPAILNCFSGRPVNL